MPHAKINVIFINNKMVSLSDNVAKNRVPTGTDQRRVYCTVSSVIRSCLLLFGSRI